MHIIVVGAGVTGIACAHAFLQRKHKVTLIESASSPNQGCSFGMSGFMGPHLAPMLCSPFKGKAGLASIFARTRKVGWDVSLSHMKFLRALANARSADKWAEDAEKLRTLAKYSVGLTEYLARVQEITYEQNHGLVRVFTNDQSWEEAHKDLSDNYKSGEWLDAEATMNLDAGLENVPDPFEGSYYMPQELSGNGSYFSKQIQSNNANNKDLTLLYHTTVDSLVIQDGKVVGVKTEKGEVSGDAVVLCNNLGARPLIDGKVDLPLQVLTGWTITAKIGPMNQPITHSVLFENRDVMITRFGNRLRVSGRFWLGDLAHDMTDKVIEELYDCVCKFLPTCAVWTDTTNWMGQTLVHPDSLPSCGKTPLEGLYLNIAHGTNGWMLAAGCAELLADLAEGKPTQIDAEAYSPLRFVKNR